VKRLTGPPSSIVAIVAWCEKTAAKCDEISLIFDDPDYDWPRRRRTLSKLPRSTCKPGNMRLTQCRRRIADGWRNKLALLVDNNLATAGFTPRFCRKLHVLLWGNKRGV